ncbi:hypothetical protein Sste5346_004702 [Sporothrix stenoceras]|uniref:NAD-dependent epimerase/dehydratase domain-containing protein n=1 Tax=Sporothrix stenoceras TaxID=5173 RepID=A0ABR3Z6M8_9PEZI
MRVLITGGAGFIGQITAKALLDDERYTEVLLADIIEPPVPAGTKYPERARCIKVDLSKSEDVASLVSPSEGKGNLDSVILLHGIMSSGAEADLKLGYRINVDATRAVLDELIATSPGVRVLYASSEAVYGRPVPKHGVTEDDIPAPEMSYGCQKIICETIINDYTRRGLLNGFSLRFPTISVRPGAPSAAISSFLSGVIREPLAGKPCAIPLRDRAWRHWMSSPKTLVHNLKVALQLPREALPLHRRSVNMPGFAVTIQQMLDALEAEGGPQALALVEERDTPEIKSTLYSWADDFDNSLALSLGMKQDVSFVDSVRDYKETMAAAGK